MFTKIHSKHNKNPALTAWKILLEEFFFREVFKKMENCIKSFVKLKKKM